MKKLRGSNQYVTRISRRTRIQAERRINLIRLYIALAITLGVFFYIVARGTIDLVRDLVNIQALAPTHKVYAKEIVTPTPTPTQRQQIDAYIKEVFGEDADKFNTLLDCENHARNPLATNVNTDQWNSTDWGIAQINDHWQGVTNPAFLTDWRINIDMAHNIFTRDHHSFKLWTCGRKLNI